MGATAQRQVFNAVQATEREGLEVVKLEVARFAAAHATHVDIGTPPLVAVENGTANLCRNVAPPLGCASAWRIRLARRRTEF